MINYIKIIFECLWHKDREITWEKYMGDWKEPDNMVNQNNFMIPEITNCKHGSGGSSNGIVAENTPQNLNRSSGSYKDKIK